MAEHPRILTPNAIKQQQTGEDRETLLQGAHGAFLLLGVGTLSALHKSTLLSKDIA
jgi:hypothetical protein